MEYPRHVAARMNRQNLARQECGDVYWPPFRFWPVWNRLQNYKAQALKMTADSAGRAEFTWHDIAKRPAAILLASRHAFTWSDDRRKAYADSLDTIGRHLGDSAELMNKAGRWRSARDAGGWYADSFCHDTITGHVIALRHAKGVDYLPATANSGCDGITIYFDDAIRVTRGQDEAAHDEAAADAAYHANEAARIEAQAAREIDDAFRAGEAAAERRQAWRWSLSKGIGLARELIAQARDIKRQGELPGFESGEVCRLIREARQAFRESWHDAADDLAAWHDACADYARGWRSNDERMAFCDGAELPYSAARLPEAA